MTYELFLTAFDRAETAGEAADWLHEFVRKGDLQVLDVVVLAKREDDSAVIRQIGDFGSQLSLEQVEDNRQFVDAERTELVLVRPDLEQVLAVRVDAEHLRPL